MRHFKNARSLLTVLAVSAIFALSSADVAFSGKPTPPPPPPEPAWELVEDGLLDMNTGLVWGVNAHDLFQSRYPELDPYMLGTWDFANEFVLPAYRAETGNDDWRFPTAVEVTDAASKNYADYAFPGGFVAYQVVTWTSDGSPKWKVLGNLDTGETNRTLQERSSINTTPVRRAFIP